MRVPAQVMAQVIASLVAAIVTAGCRPADEAPAPAVPPEARSTRGIMSNDGGYYVECSLVPAEIPLNEPFGFTVHVRDGGDRVTPAGDVELLVDGRMPDHRHGMNRTPVVERSAPGVFTVDGMLFHMPGYWEIHLDVVAPDGEVERAQIGVELGAGAFTDRERAMIATLSPLGPPPPDPTNAVADDPAAAHLGRFVFFDDRFSEDAVMSCAMCHDPAQGFADRLKFGEGRETLQRHTMSLWNVAYQRWLFWDGRADTLWAQAIVPLEHPHEQAITRLEVAHLVHGDAELRAVYEAIFGPMPPLDEAARFPPAGRPVPDDPSHPHDVTWRGMAEGDRAAIDRVVSNVGKAIAAYVRRLVRVDAPFDVDAAVIAAGAPLDEPAMSPAARRGLKLFLGKANCRTCHFGPAFSDGEFHNTGVPPLRGGTPRDPGRYVGAARVVDDPFNAAGAFSDDSNGAAADRVRRLARSSETWGQFRTPTLRNVALSPPYMHQGQLATLEDVVRYYSTLEGAVLSDHHQEQILVPLGFSEGEIADLVAFLEALTGTPPPEELLRPPDSPVLR